MAVYTPVTTTSSFAVGDTIETELFELKMTVANYTAVKRAMIVAQFANHFGGTILIGAEEGAGRIVKLHAMTAAEEVLARQQMSDAVEQCCVPHPIFGCVAVPHGGGFLVAVNVEPTVGGVVGVKIQTDKVDVGYGGASYVFPVRVGIAGGFITPENMHNFMLPALRRDIILLNTIRPGDNVLIGGNSRLGAGKMESITIDERGNRVFIILANGNQRARYFCPLTSIGDIFRSYDDLWIVQFGNNASWNNLE